MGPPPRTEIDTQARDNLGAVWLGKNVAGQLGLRGALIMGAELLGQRPLGPFRRSPPPLLPVRQGLTFPGGSEIIKAVSIERAVSSIGRASDS